jgi:signal transduction histidine kinase
MIALVRLALGLSAALLIQADASLRSTPLNSLLIAFAIYSAALYALIVFKFSLFRFLKDYWVDVVYCLLLILYTGGNGSPVILFLLFPIAVASFRRGFAAGLRVTLCAVGALFVIALMFPVGAAAGLTATSLRLFGLFLIGAFLAYWGGQQFKLNRRLTLIGEITRLSNPRFGVDALINSVIRRLILLCAAQRGLLILCEPGTSACYLYRVDAAQPDKESQGEAITPNLQAKLLLLPETLAVIYSERPRHWWLRRRHYQAVDLKTNSGANAHRQEAQTLAELLSAGAYLSVPICFNEMTVGRLFLIADRCVFDGADIGYILQIVQQVTPVMENIRLVDHLASIAAEEERKKIARDIHDSVIQPYIGLQLGLTGVRRKLTAGGVDVTRDIDTLMEVISNEVVNLRSYVRGLKEGGKPSDNLVPAVRRFAGKFSEATGISVRVIANDELCLNDRLAGEVFQMVVEGLSNIRRHTASSLATIILARRDERLNLRIENNGGNGNPGAEFTPRSLTERAHALGGNLRVRQRSNITMVDINIQL